MNELEARQLADHLARERFPTGLEYLGISLIDQHKAVELIEEDRQKGLLRIKEPEFRLLLDHARREIRARWVVSYLVSCADFRDGLTVASVDIDDETGAADLHVHPRPRDPQTSIPQLDSRNQ